jgi:hypothetical protein
VAYVDIDDTVRATHGYAKQTSHGEFRQAAAAARW